MMEKNEVADGYAGFEELYRAGNIKEVACLAHIRRKFFDIHVAQGSGVAKKALERIAAFYRLEAAIRGDPPDQRKTIRQEQAAPLIDVTVRSVVSRLFRNLFFVEGSVVGSQAVI